MTTPPPDDPIRTQLAIGPQRVPGIWRYLLPEDARWLQLPAERLASCDPCFRAAVGECREDCRCCTYFPQLPNFMLGLALGDRGARPAVERLVARGHALPTGLLATPAQLRLAVQANADEQFGRLPALICPLLGADGRCAVHAYRNSICATYFCEHDHGEEGERYWDALQALVGLVETLIAQWAMDRVGLKAAAYVARLDGLADRVDQLSEPASGAWSTQALELLWGAWRGRELRFFEACAEQVAERREELYALACERPLLEARVLERAVFDGFPPELQDELPALSEGEAVPPQALWYRLQLATRQLWELPFNEAPVALRPGAAVAPNPGDDPRARHHADRPFVITGAGDEPRRRFLCAAEARALRLFEAPQVLGEALLDRAEIRALDEPRVFLAECLRLGILV